MNKYFFFSFLIVIFACCTFNSFSLAYSSFDIDSGSWNELNISIPDTTISTIEYDDHLVIWTEENKLLKYIEASDSWEESLIPIPENLVDIEPFYYSDQEVFLLALTTNLEIWIYNGISWELIVNDCPTESKQLIVGSGVGVLTASNARYYYDNSEWFFLDQLVNEVNGSFLFNMSHFIYNSDELLIFDSESDQFKKSDIPQITNANEYFVYNDLLFCQY